MWTLIKRLVLDPEYFLSIVSRFTNWIRAAIAGLGFLLASGIVTLDSISENFGTYGWYIGRGLIVIAFLMSKGDTTPQALKDLAAHPDGAKALQDALTQLNAKKV